MAVSSITLLEAQYVPNSQTTLYTVPASTRVIIDKCTATANQAATMAINIVASGGSASAANLVMPTTALSTGDTDTCPAVVGHTLNPGDFISAVSNTASAIVIRISGRTVA